MKLDKVDIDEMKNIIKYAYEHGDDYVDWVWIAHLEDIVKEYEKREEKKCQ